MAKDKEQLIAELMKKPEKIRNICIAAHIDHGKCVSARTKLALWTGESIHAEELYNKYMSIGKIVRTTDNETIIDVSKKGIVINTLNKRTMKIEKGKITHMWKMKKTDPLVEIELKNGRKIKTTPEHKFMVLHPSGKITEVAANELQLGDSIVCNRIVHFEPLSLNKIKEFFLEKISRDGFYVFLNDSMKRKLHEKIIIKGREKVWEQVKPSLKMLSFYHCAWRGSYRLNDLLKLADNFGITPVEIYDSIKCINYRKTTKYRGDHSSVNLTLPKTMEEWEDFMYFVGLMFGDGSVSITLDNADKTIHDKTISICEKTLGIKPTIRTYKNKCPRIYINGGLTLKHLLRIIFDYPLKQKSRNIRLPLILQLMPTELSSKFISGYFDADGCVEFGRRAVSLTSSSAEMINDLQLFLMRFGCPSKIDRDTLYISGKKSLKNFGKIGFLLDRKTEKFKHLLEKSAQSRNIDYIYVNADNLKKLRMKMGLYQNDIGKYYSKYERGEIGINHDNLSTIVAKFDSADSGLDELEIFKKLCSEDVYFCNISSINICDKEEFVYDFSVEKTHNFVAEGMIIHNTTLTDNLLAGAGMISEELAGKQLFTDFVKQEQERGITIYSANVSMVHSFDNDDFLINLIDTPGHVDFGGDVTRAMRAVDGAIVVACAVEGVMPQTETVIRQALKERVKPILFINKVDRLIRELKLTPEKMQERLLKIIKDVNQLIQKYAEKEYREKWMARVDDGSVAFGSAFRKWAISVPYMKAKGITFKDIIEYCSTERDDELTKLAPLHRIVLNMVISHLPNPRDAQSYRIPKIWLGDVNSEEGKSMLKMDANAPLAAIVTKVTPDPHAGLISTARIFSGSIKKGQEIRLISQYKVRRVQQVCVYKGPQRIQMESIPAGNIVGLVGIQDASSGETICDADKEMHPFERIKHMFEPVVTKSIEPSNPKDLTKIINFLKQVSREDPTLQVTINEETGEYLVSGLGELHIDAKIERPLKDLEISIKASPPIVVYRETVKELSPEIEGKSSNKHNRFSMTVEPLEDEIYNAMTEGKIVWDKKNRKHVIAQLQEYGMNKDEAKKIEDVYNRSVLIDATKGIQYLNETMEMICEAFRRFVDAGPLSREPCAKLKAKLWDAKLHEDAIHRGPAQVLPTIKYALEECMLHAKPSLLEPVQTIRIDTPEEEMSSAMNQVQGRRGQIIDTTIETGAAMIKARIPVAEMFGFEAALKSATGGRGFYSLVDISFERVPEDLKENVIKKIRERKGL
ncbi:MAG: elongation factor EF-2 [Candidatus Aenigmarchaeota archaeon]|nr:elongation factor EF-2 [Candidatus Aenigmarchaeota archaeon]